MEFYWRLLSYSMIIFPSYLDVTYVPCRVELIFVIPTCDNHGAYGQWLVCGLYGDSFP